VDMREPRMFAGIVSDFRVINGQRGKLALFKLDDKTGVIEATADEALINAHRGLLKDDELIIASGKLQPDRFSGGYRLNIAQIWDLPGARCRFGKNLVIRVNLRAGKRPDIARLLKEFPAKREVREDGEVLRGLPLRLRLCLDEAVRELVVPGDTIKLFPSDAALASCMAQAEDGAAQVVYA